MRIAGKPKYLKELKDQQQKMKKKQKTMKQIKMDILPAAISNF